MLWKLTRVLLCGVLTYGAKLTINTEHVEELRHEDLVGVVGNMDHVVDTGNGDRADDAGIGNFSDDKNNGDLVENQKNEDLISDRGNWGRLIGLRNGYIYTEETEKHQ